jgi:hypothetical protein
MLILSSAQCLLSGYRCLQRHSLYDAVYTWFNHLKQQGHYIIDYIIMPNHVHAIIAFSNTGKSINTIISNAKRFIAYDLVNRLQKQNSHLVLSELSSALNKTERKEGKLHDVYETSFAWKPACRQIGNAEQKIHSAKVKLHSSKCMQS